MDTFGGARHRKYSSSRVRWKRSRMPVGLPCLSCLRVVSQRHQTRFHAVRSPRTGRADSYGPRPVLSVTSVRYLPDKDTSPTVGCTSTTRFPKASGLWWVGFREGKALSDLELTQPFPPQTPCLPSPSPPKVRSMREVSRRFGLDHGVFAPAAACALLGLRLIRPWA